MERRNNYLIQVQQAKVRFLTYDQQKLIRKFDLKHDEQWFYVNLLRKQYRLHRFTGDLQRCSGGSWEDANTFEEVMTLLDLLCDSRDDHWLTGRWQNMQTFGLQFHQNLLEDGVDTFARMLEKDPEGLVRACKALGGVPMGSGDISYALELFDGLRVWLQFWAGDEEFPAKVRWLWDENALMYLKYETMYFALDLLLTELHQRWK